jgi:hypothetical protein
MAWSWWEREGTESRTGNVEGGEVNEIFGMSDYSTQRSSRGAKGNECW